MRQLLFAAVLALALPGAGGAVTVSGEWALSGPALSGLGLAVRTSRDAGQFNLKLDGDAPAEVRLFRIWTEEKDVGADDRLPSALFAGFRLGSAAGSLAGTVRGHDARGLQWGSVDWSAPLELELDSGRLSILLSNETFGHGLFGLRPGRRGGADITARISYVAGGPPSPVPLPAGLWPMLVGLALLGLARLRGRRITAAAA